MLSKKNRSLSTNNHHLHKQPGSFNGKPVSRGNSQAPMGARAIVAGNSSNMRSGSAAVEHSQRYLKQNRNSSNSKTRQAKEVSLKRREEQEAMLVQHNGVGSGGPGTPLQQHNHVTTSLKPRLTSL